MKIISGSQTKLVKYKKKLLDFAKKDFRGGGSRSWDYFINNYLNQADKKSPKFTAVVDKEKMIGFIGYFPAEIKIGNNLYEGGWQIDQYTAKERRGQGIGRKVLNESYSLFDINMGIKNSEDAIRIYSKQGWIYNDGLMYKKVLDSRKFIPRALSNSLSAGFLNLIFSLKDPKEQKGYTVKKISKFGKEADALYDSVRDRYDFICRRDSRYLNWKFKNYDNFYIYKGGKLKGYIILTEYIEKKRNFLKIVDFLADPEDKSSIEQMIFFLTKYGRKKHFDSIACYITDERFVKSFEKYGFKARPSDSLHLMFFSKKYPELNKKYKRAHVTLYDSDGEEFFYKK